MWKLSRFCGMFRRAMPTSMVTREAAKLKPCLGKVE